MNRHDIEERVNNIARDIAQDNDLEHDFYGDCWNDEIRDLVTKIEVNQDELLFDEIESILNSCAEAAGEE